MSTASDILDLSPFTITPQKVGEQYVLKKCALYLLGAVAAALVGYIATGIYWESNTPLAVMFMIFTAGMTIGSGGFLFRYFTAYLYLKKSFTPTEDQIRDILCVEDWVNELVKPDKSRTYGKVTYVTKDLFQFTRRVNSLFYRLTGVREKYLPVPADLKQLCPVISSRDALLGWYTGVLGMEVNLDLISHPDQESDKCVYAIRVPNKRVVVLFWVSYLNDPQGCYAMIVVDEDRNIIDHDRLAVISQSLHA